MTIKQYATARLPASTIVDDPEGSRFTSSALFCKDRILCVGSAFPASALYQELEYGFAMCLGSTETATINVKTAKQAGLSVPPALVASADKVKARSRLSVLQS